MKVLIAGATGAIGTPLSRMLQAAGHEVLGMTRSPAGGAKLRAAGVQPIIADAMDRSALLTALNDVSADAVVSELTALTKAPAKHKDMRQTNQLRIEGTKNLLDAARMVGARTVRHPIHRFRLRIHRPRRRPDHRGRSVREAQQRQSQRAHRRHAGQ